MKKSILALGLAAAFGTAIAADVDVYGTVDVGLHFDSATVGSNRGKAERTTDRFGLDSGNLASSKFGIKGVEELGNGVKVSFILENGFQADSGRLKGSNDELFDRQATLTVEGAAGKITFGLAGVLISTTGSFDLFNATADAMDGGYGNVIGSNLWADRGVANNLITYQTPSFAGL